uniref:Protein FLX-like 2 n=1 Tax=Ananas comosus var. bracteatus TaxID=296719 RepID=A0A6V7PL83_ANACO|nr:unnamed protein product [Ananas comosus var. bracteatus]
MEQKLAAQHMEMQTLATENQRLAATHSSLRQELAAAQQELQRLHAHMDAVKAEQEQQMRALMDKMVKMEADLKSSEPVKVELQQAHAEAQRLVVTRQELMSKVQQLNQDLQRTHGDVQQIPALMTELDALRQEYQHCRATYDYERKIRVDHFESLQVMEKNYISMVREVEKLRAELTNATKLDRSGTNAFGGGPYGSNTAMKENESSTHHSVGQNAYEDGYGVPQAHGSSGAAAYGGNPAVTAAPARPGYDASRAGGYDAARSGSFEAPRGMGGYEFEASKASAYDASRGAQGPGNNASSHHGSIAQAPTPYGATQALAAPYGPAQGPLAAAHYGLAQLGGPAVAQYGSAQLGGPAQGQAAASPYGSAQLGGRLRAQRQRHCIMGPDSLVDWVRALRVHHIMDLHSLVGQLKARLAPSMVLHMLLRAMDRGRPRLGQELRMKLLVAMLDGDKRFL